MFYLLASLCMYTSEPSRGYPSHVIQGCVYKIHNKQLCSDFYYEDLNVLIKIRNRILRVALSHSQTLKIVLDL